MTPNRNPARLVLVAACVGLVLSACSSAPGPASTTKTPIASPPAAAPVDLVNPAAVVDGPITIGYLDYPSSKMMAEVYAQALEEAGLVAQLTVAGTNDDFLPAMAAGKVDIVPEYVGLFSEVLNAAVNGPDALRLEDADLAAALADARELGGPLGLTVLDATPGSESVAFAVSTAFARQTGISTLSQLAEWSRTNPLRMGGEPACEVSAFCLPYLQSAYGMVVKDYVKVTAEGAVVRAGLVGDGFDLGFLTGTDPALDHPDLTVLEQDVPQVAVGNLAPVVRTEIATREVVRALEGVTAMVTEEELAAMVVAHVTEGVPAARVAGDFIAAQGLGRGLYSGATKVVGVDMPRELPPPPPPATVPGPLRIAYAPVIDTEVAARVYAGALVNAGIPVAIGDAQAPETILGALQSGEAQFAPMRLNAVTNILNAEANGNLVLLIEGRNVNAMIARARELAEPRGIEVLDASIANVSSAWTVSDDFVANTGITTLSDLARVSRNRPVVIGGPPTCPLEPWCGRFLKEEYGITVAQFVPLDYGGGLTRGAVDAGTIDVGWLSGNDGGIKEFGFTALADDLGRESANPITPVLDADVVTPRIAAVLDAVSAAFSTEDLRAMIYAIDFQREDPSRVVNDWLRKNGFA